MKESPTIRKSQPTASWTRIRSRSDPRWIIAIVGLVGVTAVWGSTFVIVQNSIAHIPAVSFLAWRFTVAAAALNVVRPTAVRRLKPGDIRHGVILGLVLGTGYIAQTIGLQNTPAAVSGFITGLFVVLTPLFSWILLRRRPTVFVWIGVLLTTGGLALITLSGLSFGLGEILTLGCAALFALHIVGLGEWSPGRDGLALTQVQLTTTAVLCAGIALGQGLALPHTVADWSAVIFTGVLASACAYLVQTWAQGHLSTAQTSVVLTMEPVFAALFAVALGKQSLQVTTVVGGALMVAAMYVVDAKPTRRRSLGPLPDHQLLPESSRTVTTTAERGMDI